MAKSKKTAIALIVIGTILAFAVGPIVISFGFYQWQNTINTNEGHLLSFTGNPTDIIHVVFATNRVTLTRKNLTDGFDLAYFFGIQYGNNSVSYPIQVSSVNNQISVSAKIQDANGINVATIVNNQWKSNPTGIWDRNFNNYAFEAIADIGNSTVPEVIPVLQVVIPNKDTVLIGCFIDTPIGRIFATINGGFTFTNVPLKKEEMSEIEALTLFKYPSKDYPSVLRETSYTQNYSVYNPQTDSYVNQTISIAYPTSSPLSTSFLTMGIGGGVSAVGAIVCAYGYERKKDYDERKTQTKTEMRTSQHSITSSGRLYYKIKRKVKEQKKSEDVPANLCNYLKREIVFLQSK